MTRILILTAVIFLGCDRADELLIEAISQAVAEPQHSERAADCAKGRPRWASPDVQLLVYCEPVDGGAK